MNYISSIIETFGCGKWYKLHDYQWGLGPEIPVKIENGLAVQETTLSGADSWWMYCTKCGRKAWENEINNA